MVVQPLQSLLHRPEFEARLAAASRSMLNLSAGDGSDTAASPAASTRIDVSWPLVEDIFARLTIRIPSGLDPVERPWGHALAL
jgi:hypothetical protein